jgi:GNAT superfamily N-acetyltransferase
MARSAELSIRALVPSDLPRVGQAFRAAFNDLFSRNGHGLPVNDDQVGAEIARTYLELDGENCLVVMRGTRVVGSGFLHVRGSSGGVGPVCVEPGAQGKGAGHALMSEICARADAQGVASLRLIQDAFNETSFALYTRFGFVAREVLARASLPARANLGEASGVRRAHRGDLPAIVHLEQELLGLDRARDVDFLLERAETFVVEHDARVRGSLARLVRRGVAVIGPAVAETLAGMRALLAAATADLEPRCEVRILVPSRLPDLSAELLSAGLGIHSLCTYMVRGEYRPFTGYYVPTLMPETG